MTSYGSISQVLEELAPVVGVEQPAWEDVLTRADLLATSTSAGLNGHVSVPAAVPNGAQRARRRRHSRRVGRRGLLLCGLGLLGLVVVVAAAAYALGHPVIDFGKAQKGTRKVVNDFGSLQVSAPPAMAPGVLPHQTRRITTARIDGKVHTLFVAPTRKGGFCSQWSQLGGGCRADRRDESAGRIDAGGLGGPHGMSVLNGSFFQAEGERLEVEYADGQKSDIPFVWVTAPIDAGFYLYRVPDAHRRPGHQAVRVTLFDSSSHVIDSEQVPGAEPPEDKTYRLPGYPPLSVPSKADWAKRTQLFAWRADDGARIGLWIAPERGGGTCYWTGQGSGCSNAGHPVHGTIPRLNLGFEGGYTHVNLCCTVSKKIARVEARFADGDRIELIPKEGYLIWPIPSRHHPPGHRLTELVGYDAAGQQIATRPIPNNQRGLYPCSKPKSYGYGVRMCP